MTRFIPAIFVAALALPGAAVASPDIPVSPEAQAQIRTILESEGYVVRSIETEDGMFEAYATRNVDRFEISLDGDFQIVRTAQD